MGFPVVNFLPGVILVTPEETEGLRKKLATESFWRCLELRKDRPLPKRDEIPRYLRAIDYDAEPPPC